MSLRAAVAVGLVWTAAYVSLPWWAPREEIRRRLAASLSEQLHLPVRVGPVSLSWSEGVIIDGLVVAPSDEFPERTLARVGRIRCSFAPLTLLLRRRIEWMEWDHLALTVCRTEDGRWNIEPLRGMEPRLDLQRLSVRRSSVTLLPDASAPLVLRVGDLQMLRRGRDDLGRISLTGAFEQAGTLAPVSMRITAGDQGAEAVEVDCRFSQLDLAKLPLPRTMRGNVPIRSLQGRCRGQLAFAVSRNLNVEELRLELLAEDLEVEPTGPARLPKIDEAGLRITAGLDALSERVDIRQWRLRLPGMDLTGRAVASTEILQGDWDALETLRVRGTLYPDRLCTVLTGRDPPADGWTVRGPVTVRLAADRRREAIGLDLSVRADDAEIESAGEPRKPAERALSLRARGEVRRSDNAWGISLDRGQVTLGDNTILASGAVTDVSRPTTDAMRFLQNVRLRGTLDVNDPAALLQLISGIPAEGWVFAGPWSGPWSIDPGANPRVSAGLRAGPEAKLSFPGVLAKPEGKPVAVNLSAVLDPKTRRVTNVFLEAITNGGRLAVERVTIDAASETSSWTAQGRFDLRGAEAMAAWLPAISSERLELAGSVFGSFTATKERRELRAEVRANFDDVAVSGSKSEPTSWRGNLSGPLRLDAVVRTEGTGWAYQADLAAERLRCRIESSDPLFQLREKPLRLRLQGTLADAGDGVRTWNLRNSSLQMPGVSLRISHATATEANLTLAVQDAASLESFFPSLTGRKLGGQARARLHWTADPGPWGAFRSLHFDARRLRGEYRGKTCSLTGRLNVEQLEVQNGEPLRIGRLRTDGLEFRAGENHGYLLADLRLTPEASKGTFHVLLEHLDDKDLADWLSPPGAAPATFPAQPSDPQHRADRLLRRGRDWLRSAQITGRLWAEEYRAYDAQVRRTYPARSVAMTVRLAPEIVSLEYDAGLYGGAIHGTMRTAPNDPHPEIVSETTYTEVRVTPAVQPQISMLFPGNTVQGLLSRTETVRSPLREFLYCAMNPTVRWFPVGTAKMVATDGVLVGQAAPDFVTKIFPGLNLTKYPYKTMTTFTTFLPDGSARNETFFFGKYDLYMEGVTRPDRTIRYTIGLVLLGSAFPPEVLRDWKQGRVPLLKVKGRIENGELVDGVVSYPLPNETLFDIFLKNNLVYRTWVNLQRENPGGS